MKWNLNITIQKLRISNKTLIQKTTTKDNSFQKAKSLRINSGSMNNTLNCQSTNLSTAKITEEKEAELYKMSKEFTIKSLQLQKSENDHLEMRKELEDKRKIIEDQDKLIKSLGNQLNEANEELEEKLRKKESFTQWLKKDHEFTIEKLEEELRKSNRNSKTRDIEIERLQDKIQMLEIKLENSWPDDGESEQSVDETKQSNFNYAAHWVIEENLRERITELK